MWQVVKEGGIELTRREDEIRMLQLQVKELQRSLNVTQNLAHRVPQYDEEIASLQQQLLEARAQ